MKKLILLCMVAVSVCLSGCVVIIGGSHFKSSQCTAKAEFEQKQACGSGLELVCKTDFGEIVVSPSDSELEECFVKARYFVSAETQERADELLAAASVKFEVSDSKINIELLCPGRKNDETCGANFDIKVPAKTAVRLNDSYGKIKISGLTGDCLAHTSFAAIEAEDMTGNLDLTTSYGKIKVNDCKAEKILARTSFNGIDIDDSTGQLEATTSYGKINVADTVSDSVRLNTSFGDIVYCGKDIQDGFTGEFITRYGKVKVSDMDNYTGRVDMSTSYGKIKSELPITVSGHISKENISGTIANGNGSLKIRNLFGNIELK